MTTNLIPIALKTLTRDGWLLFATRFARLFAYGSLSVILVFYLIGLGLTAAQSGLVLTLTLAGDVVVSLLLTTQADRIGRRRMLVIGAILMAAAGGAFASTRNLFFLILAGTIGVISPSGNEVGPFLPIEQAALSHIVPSPARTEVFAWYTLAGSLATALGALCGGFLTQALQQTSMAPVGSYRVVVLMYAALGMLLAFLFTRLSVLVEVGAVPGGPVSTAGIGNVFGISRSRNVVLKLSSLFALDSFAGGLVVQSFAAYWFYLRFGVRPATLGAIFFLGECLCRDFCLGGFAPGGAHWPGPDDGLHAPAFERSSDSCAANAQPLAGGAGFASALQHQPDGRPGEAILYDGRGPSRRTLRGWRIHGSRTDNRGGD